MHSSMTAQILMSCNDLRDCMETRVVSHLGVNLLIRQVEGQLVIVHKLRDCHLSRVSSIPELRRRSERGDTVLTLCFFVRARRLAPE